MAKRQGVAAKQRPLKHDAPPSVTSRMGAHRFVLKFEEVFTRRPDGKRFSRWARTLKSGCLYMDGLLSPGRRKNMERIARRTNVSEERIEQFVRESPWDADGLRAHIQRTAPPQAANAATVLVLDDVGIVKQGKHSVGVKRQYSGATDGVGNCQVAVNLVGVSPGKKRNGDQVTWPLGMHIYLPKEWAEDPAKRRKVGVPAAVRFQTKPQIGLGLIDEVRREGVKHGCVTADCAYGDDGDFRASLRERKESYVLCVTPTSARFTSPGTPIVGPGKRPGEPGRPQKEVLVQREALIWNASEMAARTKTWTRVEWGQGEKGVLSGEFHMERVRVVRGHRVATDEVGFLLLERGSTDQDQDLRAYVCWGFDEENVTLQGLVGLAHARWAVEQFHRDAKQVLGLDRFEGRSWKGWYHHVTMVLLAYAFVSTLRIEQAGGSTPLPSLQAVTREVVLESATQRLMDEHGLLRVQARSIAGTMLSGYSDW